MIDAAYNINRLAIKSLQSFKFINKYSFNIRLLDLSHSIGAKETIVWKIKYFKVFELLKAIFERGELLYILKP